MIKNGAISFISFVIEQFRDELNRNNSCYLKRILKMDYERYKVDCRIVYYKLTDHLVIIPNYSKQETLNSQLQHRSLRISACGTHRTAVCVLYLYSMVLVQPQKEEKHFTVQVPAFACGKKASYCSSTTNIFRTSII
jgi:hypothetical protein